MIVVLQGAESPSHRDTIRSVQEMLGGAPVTVSVSYRSLKRRRLGERYVRDLVASFPVVLAPGVSGESMSRDGVVGMMADYYAFLADTPEAPYAVSYYHPNLDDPYESIPPDPRIIPYYQEGDDLALVQKFLEERGGIATTCSDDKRLPPLLRRYGTVGSLRIAVNQPDLAAARAAGFDAVMTQAWFAPGKFGELSVWDGAKFHRASSKMRDGLITRYASRIEAEGFDIDLIRRGDARECDRLAAWSFLSWAASLADSPESSDTEEEDTTAGPETGSGVSTIPAVRTRDAERARVELPVFTTEVVESLEHQPDGSARISSRALLRSVDEPIRACDSCYLASTCPAFEAGSRCAFKFPVEVRTPDQVKALLASMMELQASRVAFARFAEEVNGGYPDAVVGQEMDRLFRMSERLRKFDERKERLTVSVESESGGGGTGVLSRIFGSGAQPRAIEPEILMAEVIDAEVSDE